MASNKRRKRSNYRFKSRDTGAVYKINPNGRYALYWSKKGWTESVTPNDWLITNEHQYTVTYIEETSCKNQKSSTK